MYGHNAIPLGFRHAPHQWEYADEAARESATILDPSEIGKIALQQDDNTHWMLTSINPVTWKDMSGSGGGSPSGVSWDDIEDKPAVVAAGDTAEEARTAIGAGTSSLTIGTTSTTAKAGDYTPPNAGVSTRGLVLQGTSVADSVATDIEGLVTDFNALLASLRTAGVIAT